MRDQLALALTDSDNALTEILARQAAYRSGAGTAFAEVGAWVVVAGGGTRPRHGRRDPRPTRAASPARTGSAPRSCPTCSCSATTAQHAVLRRALDGLPIGGLTGTLADRFTGAEHDAAGRARAKTGTLTGANALAGSVVDDDGRLLVFVGMVAGVGTNDARAALDRFVAAIASCGCR